MRPCTVIPGFLSPLKSAMTRPRLITSSRLPVAKALSMLCVTITVCAAEVRATLPGQLKDGRGRAGVERGEVLVEQQHGRRGEGCHDHGEALPLTRRKQP